MTEKYLNKNCPCTRKCERHGNCSACISHHHSSNGIKLTKCEQMRPNEERESDKKP